MRIGDLAKAAAISVSTVRFYEGQGLMPKPETLESGYREYAAADLERLRLIVAAKRQRFPLKLIRTALDALECARLLRCERITVSRLVLCYSAGSPARRLQ